MSDISKLFAEDPLRLTAEDISAIVNHYRLARSQFNLGEKQAGSAKKLKGEAGPKIEKLDLGDLLG